MKTKEKKELRSKKLEELKILLKEAEDSLFSLRSEKMQKRLKNLRAIFLKRKEIAQILSIMRQKELEEKNEEADK